MAKRFWLLCLVVLSACTYLPEITSPTPAPCPTMAPCPTAAPCPAGCPEPTLLPFPTPTEIPPVVVPTEAPTAQPIPPVAVPPVTAWFAVEAGMPRLESNFAHPEQGCGWLGIGGQVLDEAGEAELGRVVLVSGVYNGISVDLVGLSGSAPMFGPAGFEIRLPDELALSSHLFIQVYDLDGAPLSDPVDVTAPSSCDQTLVMVNFRKQD